MTFDSPTHEIAAVVVNYNAGSALCECVASLQCQGIKAVVVVDNGSTDDSLEQLAATSPDARILHTGRNFGYGGGVNFGAQRVSGDLLLACNPDLVLQPGALRAMVDRLDRDQSLGLVGPALVTTDGGLHPSGRAFPTLGRSSLQAMLGVLVPQNPYSERYRAANRARAVAGTVDWVTGACMLIRRVAFNAVGGFDERYFMYVEEVDLCWRLARAGWQTGYEQSARVMHLGGVSTAAVPYRMIASHHLSLWRFARRTASGWQRVLLPLVALGTAGRFTVACLRRALIDRDRQPS